MSYKFSTKDSGEREKYQNGMVRDTQKDKDRFDLCDKSMYLRWAQLMARGAEKYGDNNWRKAASKEELDRFKSSAERHFMYWLMGIDDEDHAAATWFNIVAYEVTKDKINKLYLELKDRERQEDEIKKEKKLLSDLLQL
jgi:hypothetical protein